MLTEADEMNYHEMIAHVPLCVHSFPENVLVIGGGEVGTVREVLKHQPVKKIDVCEIDKKVIDICQGFFLALVNSFNNPKAEIYSEDRS